MGTPNHGRAGHRAARGRGAAPSADARDAFLFEAPRAPVLLPPWSLRADAFEGACTQCGECVDACPTHVLKLAARAVEVDFADGECTFCGACVAACPEPAFDVAAHAASAPPWNVVARVDETCLARLGVACQSCGEACEAHAIRFRPRAGSVPEPRVDATLCTGCGACVRVCPASAIEVRPRSAEGVRA
ncbi:adenylylsulfate reductase, subunit B [Burkholderiales bacterium]|nr:adenylylsulfate reductase, subunit B [Burkholderiales bacterium]